MAVRFEVVFTVQAPPSLVRYEDHKQAGHAARAVEPAADLHSAPRAAQRQAHLITVFAGAVDVTFAAFGIDAVYTPAGGEPMSVRGIARRPARSSALARPASTPRPRHSRCGASEVASPRPGDQLTVGGDTFIVQGEPERCDPDRLCRRSMRGREPGAA
jgi:hypothetical protein